jgi:hypothetical protein
MKQPPGLIISKTSNYHQFPWKNCQRIDNSLAGSMTFSYFSESVITYQNRFVQYFENQQVCKYIYLLITGGYMAIILRTTKHWLTYWGQLMSHDLHWPQNTWSVITHRSLTKSKYRFWVVDWFEFPIWHILAYCMYEWLSSAILNMIFLLRKQNFMWP